ncbi:N-acetylmuramoyl-L-alanine amidase AmiC precursor [Pseudovibrio axinellae]|uniref:N-acetylmuramoyl-L-alanine amidase n=1 Tax=Pseudovibrio axinellae TaxID=989403 RepID=A0A166B2C5_9HYPH|nr:N-acetylmuramoyl-L-alanine amidase [Pseudovibrio axinellae]KZL21829.1 N-acetylmuramoyl-L-alanine amidase AmiC precursor [Pseudovibrio axinellae]SEQ80041.1 N-acetylmuramoyl-L-alanine amidase [Pseudovibrio axinellae]
MGLIIRIAKFYALSFFCLSVALFTALPTISAASAQNATSVVSDARVAGDMSRTRFILDMDAEVGYSLSFLSRPYRLVIDLPSVDFEFPREFAPRGRGLVKSWRYGAVSKGRSRVVLDLNSPVALDKTFLLPGVQDQPTRLVIDLIETSPDEFDAAVGRSVSHTLPVGAAASVAKVDAAEAKAPRVENRLPVIVVDPGHGGVDSGAVGSNGTLEKAIVLNFGRFLKQKLEELGHYQVYLTRDEDRFISLGNRTRIARAQNADLFISIHADSITSGAETTRGASIYTLSEKASDRMAHALARRENYSDVIGGVNFSDEPDEVTDILVELTRRETKNFSIHFARLVVEELKSATTVIKNPLRSAGFQVLKSHDVPSVLIELGFLSNNLDEKMLGSDEWRERVSDAIVQATNSFFQARIAQQ